MASPSEKGKVDKHDKVDKEILKRYKGTKRSRAASRRVSAHVASICRSCRPPSPLKLPASFEASLVHALVARNYFYVIMICNVSTIYHLCHHGFQSREHMETLCCSPFGSQALTSLSIYTAPRHGSESEGDIFSLLFRRLAVQGWMLI